MRNIGLLWCSSRVGSYVRDGYTSTCIDIIPISEMEGVFSRLFDTYAKIPEILYSRCGPELSRRQMEKMKFLVPILFSIYLRGMYSVFVRVRYLLAR